MAYSAFRPLPGMPMSPTGYFNLDARRPPDEMNNPYYFGRYPAAPRTSSPYEQRQSTLPGGTLLHKGFYDLLAVIPTPNPSRLMAGWGQRQDELAAGPRYEDIPRAIYTPGIPASPPRAVPFKPSSPPVSPGYATGTTTPLVSPRKVRRISKDMVSKPTGFVHLVHASDADQLEALLTRWGPDRKLGDPRWAGPIKDMVRRQHQARAVNEVVNAMKPSPSWTPTSSQPPPLRVVNGMPTPTSSSVTAPPTSPHTSTPTGSRPTITGLPSSSPTIPPSVGRPGGSTLKWGAGLPAHEEVDRESVDYDSQETTISHGDVLTALPPPAPRKPITPSLATLEKAVSARIYFENLYFPLLRQPSSREQRRVAMERDMIQMGLTESQKEVVRARWRQTETDYLRERRSKVDPSAFKIVKTIGHGAFGVVSLVKERSSGKYFAMKQLRKTDMLRKGQEGHVRAERDVLRAASLVASPSGAEWIVKMHYSFQDRDHLYLVLDYMGGGDLLNLLIEKDVFEEDFTRFYIAEMVLAIEACHKHGFIHRDIKPDNFLFTPDGHIRLSDFGLATDLHWAHDTSYYEQQRQHLLHKHGIDLEESSPLDKSRTRRMDKQDIASLMGGDGTSGVFTWRERHRRKLAYSVCGTNSYMSPEVIRGHGYTFSCDWWSLGVIMFECLYGYPPFVSNSRHVTRQKILNWKQSLKFPPKPRVSHDGVDLMQQLLCEPEDRIGSQTSASTVRPDSLVAQARRSGFITPHGGPLSVDGADLIKKHPWFRGIDWDDIHRHKAPYRPELRNPADTRHFDDDIPAEPLAPANGAPADATKDPLLRDKTHGAQILEVRKALAFAGFTHRSPRAVTYVRADKAFDLSPDRNADARDRQRGRATVRGPREMSKKSRGMSV